MARYWALAVFFIHFLEAIALSEQRFSAAAKPSHLDRRQSGFEPRHDGQVLYYLDENLMVATVLLEPKLPTLILEDINPHIKDVACSQSSLTVSLFDAETLAVVMKGWSAHKSFVMVTNHAGCQLSDEHGVWIVNFSEIDHECISITMSTQAAHLRNVTHRMHVQLGSRTDESLTFRPEKRDEATSSTTSISSATTFNYPSPTASATGSSLSSDVSFSKLNTTLLPPDSSIAQLIPYVSSLDNIRLSCQNCTMTGNVQLTAGGFSVDSSSEMDEIDAARDFLSDGYLEFDANGISANISLELAFLPGFNVFEFEARLPSIPLGAITIAGVFELGPVLDFVFPIAITLNSPVTFSTGFTLSAPPTAKVYLNISEPTSSYTSGFSDTKLDALPFTADAEDLSLNFTVGFQPQLVIGAGLGSSAAPYNITANGGIGVYLDLPKLEATLDNVNGANEKCEPTTDNAIDGLLRLSPSVTYGGGGQWNLEAAVGMFDRVLEKVVPWISNTTSLPTQCLMWNAETSSWGDAAATKEHKNPNDSNAQGSSSNGSQNVAAMTYGSSNLAFVVAIVLLTIMISTS